MILHETQLNCNHTRRVICYIGSSVLLENTQLVKFIRNYIRVSSEDIDDFNDIKFVSPNILRKFLKIYEYCRRLPKNAEDL